MRSSYKRRFLDSPVARAALQNSGWLMLDKVVRIGAGLSVGVWMAREFGPKLFGDINYAMAFVALFSPLASMGVESVIIRDLVRYPERSQEILGTVAFLRCVSAAIAVMSCIFVAHVLGVEEDSLHLILIFAITHIFVVTDVIDLWFQSRVQGRTTVLARLPSLVVGVMLRIALLLTSWTLIAFAWIQVIELAIAGIGILIAFRWDPKTVKTWRFSGTFAKNLIKETWPLLLAGISVVLYMRIDVIMLQHLSSPVDTGIYSAATRVSEALYFIPMIIATSFAPMVIKSKAAGAEEYSMTLLNPYLLMSRKGVSLAVMITIVAPMLIAIIYGDGYAEASSVLQVHVWAAIPVFLGVGSSQYLINERLQIVSFYRTFLGLGVNVVLNLLWIPKYGAMGAAVTTLVSYIVATFSIGLSTEHMHKLVKCCDR